VEEHVGVTVERAIVDGAYGSGENRAACAERPDKPIDLLSPMRRPTDPEVDKSAFSIDDQAQTATCPKGQTVPASNIQTDPHGAPPAPSSLIATFARPALCYSLRSQPNHRTHGNTSFYEAFLRAARQRQQTDEFKQLYRLRPRIEGKQAELVSHGLRKTRYVGKSKRACSGSGCSAVNLQRLLRWPRSVEVT